MSKICVPTLGTFQFDKYIHFAKYVRKFIINTKFFVVFENVTLLFSHFKQRTTKITYFNNYLRIKKYSQNHVYASINNLTISGAHMGSVQ